MSTTRTQYRVVGTVTVERKLCLCGRPAPTGCLQSTLRQTVRNVQILIHHRDRSRILYAAIGQYPDAEHGPSEHDDFVIITADSTDGMVDIHDRRPVVLTAELPREWLGPATPKERAEQMVLFQVESSELFEWLKVDTAFSNVRNQGPSLIKLAQNCYDLDLQ